MKNHWITNCPHFLDGDKTAELKSDVDCETCVRKLQDAAVDGIVENYLESDVCKTCDGSGEVAGNYFAEDGMETCPDCGGKGYGVVSDEFQVCQAYECQGDIVITKAEAEKWIGQRVALIYTDIDKDPTVAEMSMSGVLERVEEANGKVYLLLQDSTWDLSKIVRIEDADDYESGKWSE